MLPLAMGPSMAHCNNVGGMTLSAAVIASSMNATISGRQYGLMATYKSVNKALSEERVLPVGVWFIVACRLMLCLTSSIHQLDNLSDHNRHSVSTL